MSSLYAVGLPSDKLCVAEHDTETLDYSDIDLCFVDRHWSGWYQKLPQSLAQRALEHLSHQISRSPGDLSAHLYRIIAAWHLKRGEALYGSLLDLFIVLDKRGFALRQRLLNKLAPHLTNAQRHALRQGLLFGIHAVDTLPLSYSSRFNKGLFGFTTLVVQTSQQADVEFSVLDEARDLIDSGFLDEARMILEEAIMQEPGDEELCRELLDVYRYTNDKDALLEARERFAGLELALQHEWDELVELLQRRERLAG